MVAKRFLAALIVLMLTASAFAVDAYYGFRTGMGINMTRNAGDKADSANKAMDEAELKWKNGTSFDFAPFFVLQLANPFALQTEMYFTNVGEGMVDKDGDGGYFTQRVILIPVLAKVTLMDRKLGIFAGPHFTPVAGRMVVVGKESGVVNKWGGQSVGLTFGADFGFNVGNGKLFLDARYLTQLGAEKTAKKDDKGFVTGWEDKPDVYSRYAKLAFSVGYEFGGGK